MENPELTEHQRDRLFHLQQLDCAEKAREGFRQTGNWQRYAEMSEECARIGRLLMLGEQEKGQQ